jgi:hypothetical protein
VWHAAASDYASLLPMTAMLHSGRVGMKGEGQFASQAIEPIGGEARVAEPGRRTAGGRGVRLGERCAGTASVCLLEPYPIGSAPIYKLK